MTSKILFQYFAGNILSFVLMQNGNVLVGQKKNVNRSSSSFPLHASPVSGLRKRSSASRGGNVSEGKQLLGQGLCVPYQDYANRQDSA